LSSQTILFAGLALVLGKDSTANKKLFLITISSLGFIISVCIFISVLMTIIAKYQNFKDELDKQKKEKPEAYQKKPIQWGVRTRITLIAVLADISVPSIFAVTWIIILLNYSRYIDPS
jgi:hypothetical protein